MAANEKVSFTIRRPTPISRAPSSGADSDGGFKVPSLPRHLVNANDSAPGSPLGRSTTSSPKPPIRTVYQTHEPDSSDEDEDQKSQDELVTGFDKFGVQRSVHISVSLPQSSQLTKALHGGLNSSVNEEKKKKAGPLVIPALQNRDWRALARKRRSAVQYVPESSKAQTGKDGSVGGLGVKDTINSGPVLSGLQLKERHIKQEFKQEDIMMENSDIQEDVKMEEETEDQRALRAILAGTDGVVHDGPIIDIIPTPISEAEAFKQDVVELPEVATLEDYARVPVSQFGAALLRGMGWKEGTAASRKPGKGLIEPYLPEARPALLGIGAKEREVLDDGSKKKSNKRPEKRYVPVIKKEREERSSSASDRRDRSRSPRPPNDSAQRSRRSSRSPNRKRDYDDRRNGDDRRKDDDRRRRDKDYDRGKDYRRDDRDRGRDRRREDLDQGNHHRSRESSGRRRD